MVSLHLSRHPFLAAFVLGITAGYATAVVHQKPKVENTKKVEIPLIAASAGASDKSVLFENRSASEIEDYLSGNYDSWSINRNRVGLLAQAAARIFKTAGSSEAFAIFARVFSAERERDPDGSPFLAKIAFRSVFKICEPSEAEITAILKTMPEDLGILLLNVYGSSSPLRLQPLPAIYGALEKLRAAVGWNDSPELQKSIFAAVFSSAADTNTEECIEFLQSISANSPNSKAAIGFALSQAASLQPEAVLKILSGIAKTDSELAVSLASGAELSPSQVRTISDFLNREERAKFLTRFFESNQLTDIRDLNALADQWTPKDLPREAAKAFGQQLLRTNGGSLADWLKVLSPKERAGYLVACYDDLDQNHRLTKEVSRNWLDAIDGVPGINQASVHEAVVRAAEVVDLQQGLQYCERIQDPAGQEDARNQVYLHHLQNMAFDDPAKVREFVQSMPGKPQLALIAAKALADNAPEEALKWMDETGDPVVRNELRADLLMNTNSSAAIPLEVQKQWLLDPAVKDSPLFIGLSYKLADAFALSDPEKAVDLVRDLPNPLSKNFAMDAFLSRWSAADPVDAAKWIQDLPDGALRDHALSKLVENSAYDPASAFGNAAMIQDQGLRTEAEKSVAYFWIGGDLTKVSAALEASPLPPGEKDKVRELIRAD